MTLLPRAENAIESTDVIFITRHLISPISPPVLTNSLNNDPLTVNDHYLPLLLAPLLCSFDGRRDITWQPHRRENDEAFRKIDFNRTQARQPMAMINVAAANTMHTGTIVQRSAMLEDIALTNMLSTK